MLALASPGGLGSSPLARGKQGFREAIRDVPRIIPACAGETSGYAARSRRAGDHPRLRGGNSTLSWCEGMGLGSSPLARGKRPYGQEDATCLRIIPACAGETTRRAWSGRRPRDHPRLRGGNTITAGLMSYLAGSSPLARGKPHCRVGLGDRDQIIPACAGETSLTSGPGSSCADHPRLRGGNRYGEGNALRGARIIPACAGETYTARLTALSAADHPRLRGGNIRYSHPGLNVPGSSPLARGKLVTKRGFHVPERIIPACAGETAWRHGESVRTWDHPRLRGGNPVARSCKALHSGSSPLARGKRLRLAP